MRKILTSILFCCITLCAQQTQAQTLQASDSFFIQLKKHCGKSYDGTITAGGREGDGFTGKRLVMQVLLCENNQIKIPFYVGDDSSRTWIFTLNNHYLTLEHDHRERDGTPDKITLYGGSAPNTGTPELQFFPANPYTCNLLKPACTNVWWVTLTKETFTYNLRRIGSDRVFTVSFDLTKPVDFTGKPWGWDTK
jgi:hypothetical protein